MLGAILAIVAWEYGLRICFRNAFNRLWSCSEMSPYSLADWIDWLKVRLSKRWIASMDLVVASGCSMG